MLRRYWVNFSFNGGYQEKISHIITYRIYQGLIFKRKIIMLVKLRPTNLFVCFFLFSKHSALWCSRVTKNDPKVCFSKILFPFCDRISSRLSLLQRTPSIGMPREHVGGSWVCGGGGKPPHQSDIKPVSRVEPNKLTVSIALFLVLLLHDLVAFFLLICTLEFGSREPVPFKLLKIL